MGSVNRTRRYAIGNWKMNTEFGDAVILAEGIKYGLESIAGVEAVLCPPFVWLYPMVDILKNAPKNLQLGAQNMHWLEKGAYTGEISPLMLKGLVQYVILGHSERRYYFNESDELVNDKVLAALASGMTPVLCVGEKAKRKEDDKNDPVIDQLVGGLKEVSKDQMKKIIIAYEPVWAIGTGDAATGEYAGNVARKIRNKIVQLYGEEIAHNVPILYGGSVTGKNTGEFMDECELDGVLVGGASLKIDEFLEICKQAGEYR